MFYIDSYVRTGKENKSLGASLQKNFWSILSKIPENTHFKVFQLSIVNVYVIATWHDIDITASGIVFLISMFVLIKCILKKSCADAINFCEG